jgi:hypothetical protein
MKRFIVYIIFIFISINLFPNEKIVDLKRVIKGGIYYFYLTGEDKNIDLGCYQFKYDNFRFDKGISKSRK